MTDVLVQEVRELVAGLLASRSGSTGPTGSTGSTGSTDSTGSTGDVAGPAWDELARLVELVDGQPTEAGGGRGTRAAVLVATELAFNNLSTPWVEAVCVGRWLQSLTDADGRGADLVLPGALDEQRVELHKEGARWLLSGSVVLPWGDDADRLVLALDHPAGLRLPVVELMPPHVSTVQTWSNAAGEPRHRISLSQVECVAVATLAGVDTDVVLGRWALGVAAQLLGALLQVQALCSQSGPSGRPDAGAGAGAGVGPEIDERWPRAIASVPRHALVDIAGQVALTRAAVSSAVGSIEREGWTRSALARVAAAKVQAGEAAWVVSSLAHRLHGADGATRGHPLGRSTRRLLAWRDEGGDETVWSQWLGRRTTEQPTGAGLLGAFDPAPRMPPAPTV